MHTFTVNSFTVKTDLFENIKATLSLPLPLNVQFHLKEPNSEKSQGVLQRNTIVTIYKE